MCVCKFERFESVANKWVAVFAGVNVNCLCAYRYRLFDVLLNWVGDEKLFKCIGFCI